MRRIGINIINVDSARQKGTLRYIQNLFMTLSNFELIDCKFIIYKQKHINKELFKLPSNIDIDWVDVPSLGNGMKRIIFEQTLFYLYLKKSDILYSNCTSLPLFFNKTKIFTLHDVYFKTHKGRYSKFKSWFLDISTRIHIKISENILTVSEYSKKEILKYYHISPAKIKIVPNFIPQKTHSIEDRSLFNEADFDNLDLSKKFFLYVGSLHKGKNIRGMIEAFSKFNERNEEYQLLIVGKDFDNIYNFCNNFKNIYYLGYQSDETVDYLMSKAYSIVLLSFCEGFGIPPLEGFYYQKPSLVANNTSLPEIVGDAGIKVSPFDLEDMAIGFEAIVNNYDTLRNNTLAQLEKYKPTTITEDFLKALDIKFIRKN